MTDEQILERFRDPATREAAFTALVDVYQERIFGHMLRMVRSREDAADLTQEVFVRIWSKLEGFEGRARLYTWIYRIAANEALALLQKRKRMPVWSLDDPDRAVPESAASPDLDGAALTEALERAVDDLPDRQRQVFLLRYWDEMPYREMAERLGKSVGSLKASYHHAVRKIERALFGEVDD